jgi:hypothetical protein
MHLRLSNWLHRVSTGKITLAALVIFLLFTALVLPGQAADADEVAGGAETPDLSLYYTADDLYQMAQAYGEEGRAAYIRARFTFDVVWPLVYTFFLVTALSWLSDRVLPTGSVWQLANLAPILAASLDFLENLATSLIMWRFPMQTPVVDILAGPFTALKWLFVSGSFVLLVAAAGAGIWRVVRGRTKL